MNQRPQSRKDLSGSGPSPCNDFRENAVYWVSYSFHAQEMRPAQGGPLMRHLEIRRLVQEDHPMYCLDCPCLMAWVRLSSLISISWNPDSQIKHSTCPGDLNTKFHRFSAGSLGISGSPIICALEMMLFIRQVNFLYYLGQFQFSGLSILSWKNARVSSFS